MVVKFKLVHINLSKEETEHGVFDYPSAAVLHATEIFGIRAGETDTLLFSGQFVMHNRETLEVRREVNIEDQGICEKHCSCDSDGTQMVIVNHYCMGPHRHVPEGYLGDTICVGCLAEAWNNGEVKLKET